MMTGWPTNFSPFRHLVVHSRPIPPGLKIWRLFLQGLCLDLHHILRTTKLRNRRGLSSEAGYVFAEFCNRYLWPKKHTKTHNS